jgi:hypothetical protein
MKKVVFADVAKVATDVQKRGVELWSMVALFVMGELAAQFKAGKDEEKPAESLKAKFKENEEQYKKATEVNLNSIGAYRSAKSVAVAASRYGVSIVEKGNPVGKTEVEGKIKELREPQSDITTISRAFVTIQGKVSALTDKGDVSIAYGLAKKCMDVVEAKAAELLKPKEMKQAEKQAEQLLEKVA